MTTSKKLITADDLLALPDDGNRYELVRGELKVMAPAGDRHGEVADRIGRRVGNFVELHRLGRTVSAETGVWIEHNPDTVRAPDYAFTSHARLFGLPASRGYAETVPDLIVEVVSPNDTQPEIDSKTRMWLESGVRLALVVYPDAGLVVAHHADGTAQQFGTGDTLTAEPVLPGFECPVADIFTY